MYARSASSRRAVAAGSASTIGRRVGAGSLAVAVLALVFGTGARYHHYTPHSQPGDKYVQPGDMYGHPADMY